VEQVEVVISRQWHGKHISAATDTDTTIENMVFYAAVVRGGVINTFLQK
jgi:hypothetical protein